MSRFSILSLVALLAVALVAVAVAQSDSTANVEVRVWQSTSDAERLYISARPEGGRWDTLGTIPLEMDGLNSRGTYRYGDITVAVPIVATNIGGVIEDSKWCNYLVRETESHREIIDITIFSCSEETLQEGNLTVVGLRGELRHNRGDPVPYTGSVYEAIIINWSPGSSVCRGITEWLLETYAVATVHECFARVSVSYEGDAWPAGRAVGTLYASNGTGQWAFDASLGRTFKPDTIQLYRADGQRRYFDENR